MQLCATITCSFTTHRVRLAEKTDEHEALQEQLHQNEKLLVELQDERTKTSREGSSRLANLNQALMKVYM